MAAAFFPAFIARNDVNEAGEVNNERDGKVVVVKCVWLDLGTSFSCQHGSLIVCAAQLSLKRVGGQYGQWLALNWAHVDHNCLKETVKLNAIIIVKTDCTV